MRLSRPWALACAAGLSLPAVGLLLIRSDGDAVLESRHVASASNFSRTVSPGLFHTSGPVAELESRPAPVHIRQASEFTTTQPRLQLAPPSGSHSVIREPSVSKSAILEPSFAPVAPSYADSLGSDPYKPTSVPVQELLQPPLQINPPQQQMTSVSPPAEEVEERPLQMLRAGSDNPALRPVNEMAAAHVKRGFSLGDRNAIFAARTEFIQALRIVAQAIDAQSRVAPNDKTSCSQALTRGLQALEEADDFVPPGSQLDGDLDLQAIVSAHRTPVGRRRSPPSQIAALQMYFDYARDELIAAAAGNPVASQALAGLGKTYTATKEQSSLRLSAPKAMVFHQAAVATNNGNHLAANELGVLLAKFGQWEQAKQAFIQSLRVERDPSTWQNLAAVHEHLGEAQLAQLAIKEKDLLTQGRLPNVRSGVDGSEIVQWVDPKAFAGPPEEMPVAPPVAASQAQSTPAARSANKATSGSWFWPFK